VLAGAAGASGSTAPLHRSGTHRGRHSLYAGNVLNPVRSDEVRVLTLDDVAATVLPSDGAIHLLKVDVEGAEMAVLEGAGRILRTRVEAVWLEFWPDGLEVAGEDPAACVQRLADLGFAILLVDLAGGRALADPAPAEVVAYCDELARRYAGHPLGYLPIVYLLCVRSPRRLARLAALASA
jgi:hypothetical protein